MDNQASLNEKIADGINEIFKAADNNDIIAFGEPRATNKILPEDEDGRRLVRNRIPEVTIVREVNKMPDVVSEINDISRWFPKLTPQLPYVQISISSDYHTHPGYITQNGVDLPPDSSIHDNPFPLEYHIIEHDDGENILDSIDVPDGLEVKTTTQFNIGWVKEEFLPEVYSEITEPTTEDLLDFYATKYYAENWEDTIFHFDQVLRAYRQNQIGVLIVLISVFFESHLYSELDRYMEDLQENPAAGSLLNDSMKFEKILNHCRYFDIVDEPEYGLLMKMKSARNSYAHDMDAFRNNNNTDLERENKVDDVVKLYESYVGVKNSMVE